MPFRILGEPWKVLGGQFGGILGSGPRGQAGVDFLFRDDFITDEGAPLTSPRTAEPGPGTGTIVDTMNFVSISGELMRTSDINVSGDPSYDDDVARTRVAGLSEYAKSSINSRGLIGWHNVKNTSKTTHSIFYNGVNLSIFAGVGAFMVGTVTAGNEYEAFLILRDNGAFYLIRGAPQFSSWTIAWVDSILINSGLYAGWIGISLGTDITTIDTVRVSQLPSPWDTDYGIATDRLAGARSVGDTFVHGADCLIEFTIDSLGAGNMNVFFRIQDATNFWEVRATAAGNFVLRETIGGVGNIRASVLGVLVGGERIVIIADDETIRGYYANTLAWTYALAANFKTEITGELDNEGGVGGSVSDIISWPRRISSLARRALDRVANA